MLALLRAAPNAKNKDRSSNEKDFKPCPSAALARVEACSSPDRSVEVVVRDSRQPLA